MILTCGHCGAKNNEDAQFCQQCGNKIATTDIANAARDEFLRQVFKPITEEEIAAVSQSQYPYTPDPRYQSMPPDVTYLDEIPAGMNLGIDNEHGALLVDYHTSLSFYVYHEVFLERKDIGVYKRYRTGVREYLLGKKPLFGSQKKRIIALFPHVIPGRYEVEHYDSFRFKEKYIIKIVAGEVGMLDLTEYKSHV